MAFSPARAARVPQDAAANIASAWASVTEGAPWGDAARRYATALTKVALDDAPLDRAALTAWREALAAVPHQQISNQLQLSAQDQVSVALWSRHKIVYAVDTDLWTELADTDPAGVVPGEFLRRLPHPNPYVAFTEPVAAVTGDRRERIVIEGFFIDGGIPDPTRADGRLLTRTDNPGLNSLVLVLTGAAVDPATGQRREVQFPSMRGTIRVGYDQIIQRSTFYLDDLSLQDHIDAAMTRQNTVHDPHDRDSAKKMLTDDSVESVIRTAMSLVLYLCAQNADLQPAATPTPRKKPKKRDVDDGPPPQVYEVGFRIGAALRAHRAAAPTGPATPTGRTVAAHVRRAHWHRFRAGEGRKETVVHWLPPIPVNVGDDDAATPTVVPVRKNNR